MDRILFMVYLLLLTCNAYATDCNKNGVPDDQELGLTPALYWADDDDQSIMMLEAGNAIPTAIAAQVFDPRGLALDLSRGKIYWSSSNGIERANLDGTQREMLISTQNPRLSSPQGIDVDPATGVVYWVDSGNDTLRRMVPEVPAGQSPSTRTDAEILVDDEDLICPTDVIVVGALLVWSDQCADELGIAELDFPRVPRTLLSNQASPLRLTYDTRQGVLYWSDDIVDLIRAADLSEDVIANVRTVVESSNPTGVCFDTAVGQITWADTVDRNISTLGLGTCARYEVIGDVRSIRDTAVISLAATNCNGDDLPDDCQVLGNDCNRNGIPDDCEVVGNDCDQDGTPDDCQRDPNAAVDCCARSMFQTYAPTCIETTAACTHVLILPSRDGVIREDNLQELIEDGSGATAQVWDWNELASVESLGDEEKRLDVSGMRSGGGELARAIRRWKRSFPGKSLNVLAGGEGAWLFWLACEAEDPNGSHTIRPGSLDRVVVVSGALSNELPLGRISACATGGIYNAFGLNEVRLTGSYVCGLFGFEAYTFEHVPWQSAGRFGYRAGNAGFQFVAAQLAWREDPNYCLDNCLSAFDAFLDAYNSDYFTAYLLPVAAGGDIPAAWATSVPDSYEDGNDPPNVMGEGSPCFPSGSFEPLGVAISRDTGALIWTDPFADSLRRSDPNGAGLSDLPVGDLRSPVGVAIDRISGRIYWVDDLTDELRSCDASGGDVRTLAAGLLAPVDVAVDPLNQYVYWTDFLTDRIERVRYDGSQRSIVIDNLVSPMGIDIDVSTGTLYWVDDIVDAIFAAPSTGGIPVEVVSSEEGELIAPFGLCVDASADRLFWTDWLQDWVRSSTLSGANIQTLRDGLISPKGIDCQSGRVWWTDDISDSITAIDMDGLNERTVLASLDEPGCLASPAAMNHVVILPGILGSGGERNAIDLLQETGVASAQLWDWTRVVPVQQTPLFDRLVENEATRAAGLKLANALARWKQDNPETRLHIIAGSGGGLIVSLACEARRPDGAFVLSPNTFEKVVFVSAAMSTTRSLDRVDVCCREGVYVYYSDNDSLLTGIICAFGLPINAGVPWPAVGRFGYRSCVETANYRNVHAQLGWREEIALDNDGRHLQNYQTHFFETYFVPLFTGGITPAEWARSVDPSYKQTEAALCTCAGEFTGDGSVGLEDLALVLSRFGASGVSGNEGDTNGDGFVDLTDLAQVLALFGRTCSD